MTRNPFLGAAPAHMLRHAAKAHTAQNNTLVQTQASRPWKINSAGGLAYAAAGNTTTLLTYAVPSGQTLVVNKAALVNIGPTLIDYQGLIAFHMLRNGAGVRGFESLLAQVGTLAQPEDVQLIFNEGEILTVTVSTLAGQAVPAANVPAARLIGFISLAVPRPNILRRS